MAPFWIKPEMDPEEWGQFIPHRTAAGRRWKGGVAKFFIDGVIDTGTGWLYEPDSEGEGTLPFWPDPSLYRRAVARFAGEGFQCATHATGDRGVREALDAYRDAGAAAGVRHRIEHIETLQPQDLPRFAAEGVVPSMQAQHMMEFRADRDDNWSQPAGRRALQPGVPDPLPGRVGSACRAGLGLAGRAVRPADRDGGRPSAPRARSRRARGLRRPGDRRSDRAGGLHHRVGPHRRRGGTAGRIAPGFVADLTVFAEDPVECDPDDLVDLPVLRTIVDGETVYRSDG